MTIRVALNHRTRYAYNAAVRLGPQIIRLRPAPHCRTPVRSYSLKVTPSEHFINWQQDPHGNFLARCVFPEPARSLEIEVDLIADMTVVNPFDFFLEQVAEKVPFPYDAWLARELRPFLEVEDELGHRVEQLALERMPKGEATVDFLVALNQHLQSTIRYLIRLEPGVQSAEETLTLQSGSCRDSAWLLVQLLRRMGLAARFVSGYLIQLTSDIPSLDGPSGPSADFTDLHAWAEVYLPGAGWVGLDPTSGLFAGEGHLPLACTPDPTSAAPITGSLDPCEVSFDFHMQVTRVREDPRVTKPYSDEQWLQIERLGHQIDADLRSQDVRLTMGGEPTFVSIDDMDGAEWNTAAVGPHKRHLSEVLICRLRERFAPGGMLHFGQGKWYPGESLPRWALACFWRTDGEPIWHDDRWIARENHATHHGLDDAHRFLRALAEELGIRSRWILPAFEDVFHYLAKERQLPVNVDPADPKLNDPEERERIRRVFTQGLSTPVGYVMPLARQWPQGQAKWVSGPWPIRGDKLLLLAGDSPIGLRLPIESLPWAPAGESWQPTPPDPLDVRPPLPRFAGHRQWAIAHTFPPSAQPIQEQVLPELESGEQGDSRDEAGRAGNVVRTAMCIEPRGGRLHLFMPPVYVLEDYLELVSTVERVAARLETPIILEGYLPPPDPRLQQIKVTPDPGVIEVNIHPATNWDQLVTNTTSLYEEARLSRLGTEKFDLDGRHTGTGGGNHVVLGGPTPRDSPFLRRPDLLKSLIGYWLNHPSLSYLFSGRFIGPTSQAPRVDEGRSDALYELELAFSLVPPPGIEVPPWLVDRIFRNLLVDGTGNTHRAEFCIDKLYSPDGITGRLGLVEFRAFEMPPHARMSLTQQLLIRGLIAWLWRQPYEARPVPWGTALHDRFLLPYFTWRDFREVIRDLQGAGQPFDEAWFAPHFEFRFPLIGEATIDDVHLELRAAIEPWYVLGEEAAAGGTVRYVDSSVERLQVRVRGLTESRHLVCCNGRQLPLQKTGTPGEFVAGVRYRAWQPPHCLHPTIPVHTPLVVDLLDRWTERSLGGVTYHVAHPAGRNYETFPVNAFEAEARRAARFVTMGHTPGKIMIPPAESNPTFPSTLDLRLRNPLA